MPPFQGTKFSSSNIVIYESLGSLLKDYRKWRKLTQERFAESIRVSVRELRNWEANRRRAGIENLHDISEVTGIPMQVCTALNTDQPIWYSLQKRLFMYSSIEEAQFSSIDIFKYSQKLHDSGFLKRSTITKDRQIDMILSCHQDLYGPERLLQRNVIKAASLIVPDLNYTIMLDCWNHYVAHQVCLPIKMDVYRELKEQKTIENYLTSEMISDIIAQGEGVFFYYSSFAANISTTSMVILNSLRAISKIKQKERYVLASHTGTKEATIMVKNLGMKLAKDYAHSYNEICPAIYEMKLDYYLRPDGPIGWAIKQIHEKDMENRTRKSKQVWSPTISSNKTNKISRPSEKPALEMPGINSSIVVGNSSSLVGKNTHSKERMKRIKPKIQACTNSKCTFYRKTGKGNVIFNGTYRTKEGSINRRFYCNKCGKSFCSRTETIFYGLRSPEENILKALKLLVKGMPLQGVAKSLGVTFNTVRRWLEIAVGQREKIDSILLKYPGVSQIELNTLWTFVKTKSLHQRAIILRTQGKSY